MEGSRRRTPYENDFVNHHDITDHRRRPITRPDQKKRRKKKSDVRLIPVNEILPIGRSLQPIYSPLCEWLNPWDTLTDDQKSWFFPPGTLKPVDLFVPKTHVKPTVGMAALYDLSYDAIEDPNAHDDEFADILTGVRSLSEDTRRYFYSSGIKSMENVVECFGTHELIDSFIWQASKRHGQDVNVPVFGDAARNDQTITLRFPLTQRTQF
jgi:hypothetical protein